MENQPSRILIIDTAWVGDVVFTTALVEAARSLWPRAKISLVVSPRAAGIVRSAQTLDEVIVFDKSNRERSVGALMALGKRLRQDNYDIVLCAHPSFRSALLTKLSRAPIRAGYEARWARWCFTHTCANDLSFEPYHVERRLNLLRALGLSVPRSGIHVPVTHEMMALANQFLNDEPVSAPLLGLVPGSAWGTKRWPAEKFRAVASAAYEKLNARCLIFGGDADAALLSEIAEGVQPAPIIVLGKPLNLVAALLSRCRWVVGNDTGISYLAIAVRQPSVRVLYGSTQVNFRFHAPHQAIPAGIPCCCPRTGHGKQSCSWGDPPVCMNSIEPGDVLNSF